MLKIHFFFCNGSCICFINAGIFEEYCYLSNQNLFLAQLSTTIAIIWLLRQLYILTIGYCGHYRDLGAQICNYIVIACAINYAETFVTTLIALNMTSLQCSWLTSMRAIPICAGSILR